MPGEVDLRSALPWAEKNLEELITESNAEIISAELPSVWANFTQMGHVFQNLLSNAIKYRKKSQCPSIHVSARARMAHEWVISVSDNGIGIAPEYQEQIFAPFKRLHGREISGTGIGLALCRDCGDPRRQNLGGIPPGRGIDFFVHGPGGCGTRKQCGPAGWIRLVHSFIHAPFDPCRGSQIRVLGHG